MAKLNVEVEVDWLGEDDSVDELIKSEIISSVSRKVEEKLVKSAMAKFEASVAKFESEIDKRVAEVATKVTDDFVNTQKFPRPKNSYDKNPEYKTITEILGEKLEASLNRSVDKDGQFTDSSYSRAGTRLDWLTGKLAEKLVDERVKESVKDIKAHIEKYILEKVKGEIMTQLSESVLKKIDLNKIK